MRLRSTLLVAALLGIFLTSTASGQVLFTGKTSGSENGSIYLFGTATTVDGSTGSNNWAGLVLGATDNFDLVAGYGDMTSAGKHFPYAAFGGVLGLPTKKLGFDTIVYQLFSIPHVNRKDSSTFFGNSVLIVSKDLKINGYTLTPYTGYNGNYAFGSKDRVLTYTEVSHQIPVGIFLPINKSWGLTTEYDHGKARSFGLAVNYSFRYRGERE